MAFDYFISKSVTVNIEEGMTLSSKITSIMQTHSSGFTKSEIKICHYINAHQESVMYMSITELADLIGVGEATILRFCRKIGYKGYQDFKLAMAKEPMVSMSQTQERSYIEKLYETMIKSLENTKHLLVDTQIKQACTLIEQTKHVYVYGVGSSGLSAREASSKFLRIGKHIQAITDSHFQAINSATLTSDDVVIALTITGSTIDLLDSVKIAKERGCQVIAITSYIKSPITKYADVVLLTSGKENPLEGGSLSAKMSQLFMIELLCIGYMMNNSKVSEEMKNLTAAAVANKLN